MTFNPEGFKRWQESAIALGDRAKATVRSLKAHHAELDLA